MLNWAITMSTNTNPELPDLKELERLANQFFKSTSGDLPEPQEAVQPEQLRRLDLPSADVQQNPYDYLHPPKSIIGGGISPSAVNQGNAVDLKNPQTGFADPNLTPA